MVRRRRSSRDRHRTGHESEPPNLERVLTSTARVEHTSRGQWSVRPIRAAAALKPYTCPGCTGVIAPGTAHLVIWRHDWIFGEADAIAQRRHWHTGCWRKWSVQSRVSC